MVYRARLVYLLSDTLKVSTGAQLVHYCLTVKQVGCKQLNYIQPPTQVADIVPEVHDPLYCLAHVILWKLETTQQFILTL